MSQKFSTETELINACIAANNDARQELYQRFYGKMMALCLRYTKNRDDARDVLHEGFLKVFDGLGSFRNAGSLEGWIRTIMVNASILQYHKQNKLRITHSSLEDDEGEQTAESFVADDDIIAKIGYEELLQLIRGLPPAYQTVFNLFAIEGYGHKEIAEMLDISEGTSKSNLFKARTKLQQQINLLAETPNTTYNVQ